MLRFKAPLATEKVSKRRSDQAKRAGRGRWTSVHSTLLRSQSSRQHHTDKRLENKRCKYGFPRFRSEKRNTNRKSEVKYFAHPSPSTSIGDRKRGAEEGRCDPRRGGGGLESKPSSSRIVREGNNNRYLNLKWWSWEDDMAPKLRQRRLLWRHRSRNNGTTG